MWDFDWWCGITDKSDSIENVWFWCNPGYGLVVHSSSFSGLLYKEVVFRKLGFPELEFVGDCRILPTCVILAFEAKRLLHKGCEAYLAHVVDMSTPDVTLGSVLVVWEFLDVFLEDLPRLPPDWELEFGIELLPKSTLISIPPYRMAPIELKELKN